MSESRGRRAIPLEEAIRSRVHALRTERGWTWEELAGIARHRGFDWTHNTVKNVEAGSRAVTLAELAFLFSIAGGEVAFFGSDSPAIALSPAWWIEPGGLEEIAAGTSPEVVGEAELARWRAQDEESADRRLTEERAAEALGIDVPTLKVAARDLWGRSLTRERERRLEAALGDRSPVEARTRQAMRGHLTRALLAELRVALAKAPARRSTRRKEDR